LVLEEQISVTTEAPQVEAGQEDMVRAPMAYFAAGAPFVEAPAFLTEVMRRNGALLVLILVGVTVLFLPWKWSNDDIVVVPPNVNDSTKVDSGKLKLDFLQPFQEEESHFVLDKSKILQDFSNDESSIYYTDSSIVLTLHGLSSDLDLFLFGTNNGNGDSLNFREEFVQGNKANYQKEYKLNKLILPSASENKNNAGEKNIYVEQIAKKDASPPLTKDSSSRYSLFVDGSVISEEVKVTLGSYWADHVFTPHYPRSAMDSFLLTKHGLTEIQILQDSADKLLQFSEDRIAQLTAQVDNSRFINITNFSVTPKSQRSKSTITSKKRSITSFLICFTTLANPLVKNGHQIFYLRLLSESGESLQIGSQEIIAHGQLIKHTLPIIVDYDGTSKDICLQWESTEKLISGRYKLEIFNNDRLVGVTMFNLK